MTENTEFVDKVSILAELWVNFRNDQNFEDFFQYNDLGMPLAYALDNDLVVGNDKTARFIEETFALLLAGLDVEDTGFKVLEDLLNEAE